MAEVSKISLDTKILLAIAEVYGGTVLTKDLYYKKDVNGEWVGKRYVQKKDLSTDWFENVKPEDIDTRYYNLDGSKK